MIENDENKMEVDKVAVRKLSDGLLQIYYPKLKSIKSTLSELTKKQEVLCEELHSENLRFSEAHSAIDLQEIFAKIKIYKEKLAYIKRTMLALHEQSSKLKKRALKLEQQKQKEALEKVQQRENEERLIGKPSASSSSSSIS